MITWTKAGRGCSAPVRIVAVLATLTFLAGCASQRDPSTQLQSARTAYQKVERDPAAARSAAESLERARRELDRAEKLLTDGADMAIVDHHAYLAERYTQIAENEVQQAELQTQIEQARNRREELRVAMERRKVEQAQEEQSDLRARLSFLQAKQTERGIVLTLSDVLFAFDEAGLKPGGERAAERLADFLEQYPSRRIRVEGHTDSVGPEAYNERLSLKRAQAVKQAIANDGISPSRIVTEGYGETYPVASNDDPAGRQRNRRVEVLISDQEGRLEGRS